jgi:phage recombination protein Bet
MAQQARQAMTLAPTRVPPTNYKGTAQSWKVLAEAIWPSARSSESIMLAVAYCAARHLDPFRRPVHIVPVYNSALRREVETVWPGISELLTTASRSKEFAGVDEPTWGSEETRTFTGTDREGNRITRTVTFYDWCSVKVWRRVGGERVAFSQPVYWLEAYGRQSFRSEVPNDMWGKRPLGQLHKCALAASLRLGFPEDIGGDYSAEEMEGREIDAGGVVIDQEDPTPATTTERDRRVETYPLKPPADAPGEPVAGLALLEEENGTVWLKHLRTLLGGAKSEIEVAEIAGHPRVRASLETAPTLIVGQINDMLHAAHERVRPSVEEEALETAVYHPAPGETPGGNDSWPDDPIGELLAEVEAMNLEAIETLAVSAAWRAKTRAIDFPPDEERLREAIATRRAILKGSKSK